MNTVKKLFYSYKEEVTHESYLGHVASPPVKNVFSSSHMLTRSTDPERRDGICVANLTPIVLDFLNKIVLTRNKTRSRDLTSFE